MRVCVCVYVCARIYMIRGCIELFVYSSQIVEILLVYMILI